MTIDELIDLIRSGETDSALAALQQDPGLAQARSQKPGQLRGATALHRAAHRDEVEVCERLLDLGANVNDAATEWWQTPLAWAADAGRVAAVKLLLQRGADVNQDAIVQTTALHAAAMGGSSQGQEDPARYAATAQVLIEHGADVNRRTSQGRTPLDDAIAAGNTAVAEVVRQHGGRAAMEQDE